MHLIDISTKRVTSHVNEPTFLMKVERMVVELKVRSR